MRSARVDNRRMERFRLGASVGRVVLGLATLAAVLAPGPAPAAPDDPGPAALVAELLSVSAEFAALWEDHEVAVRHSTVKRFIHPVVGAMELDCEVLLSSEHAQRLIVHTARPGTESAERLELLRVLGLQDLAPQG